MWSYGVPVDPVEGEEVGLERHKAAAVVEKLGDCPHLPLVQSQRIPCTYRVACDAALCQGLHERPWDRGREVEVKCVVSAARAQLRGAVAPSGLTVVA